MTPDLTWPAQLAIAGAVVAAVIAGTVIMLREIRAMRARSLRPPPPRPAMASFDAGASGNYPDPFATLNARLASIECEARETQAQMHEIGKQIAGLAESMRWVTRFTDRIDSLERRMAALPHRRHTPSVTPPIKG